MAVSASRARLPMDYQPVAPHDLVRDAHTAAVGIIRGLLSSRHLMDEHLEVYDNVGTPSRGPLTHGPLEMAIKSLKPSRDATMLRDAITVHDALVMLGETYGLKL